MAPYRHPDGLGGMREDYDDEEEDVCGIANPFPGSLTPSCTSHSAAQWSQSKGLTEGGLGNADASCRCMR